MKGLVGFGVGLALASSFGAAAAQQGSPSTSELHVLPVQGNVYMLVGPGGNVTIQTGKDGVLLVDTMVESVRRTGRAVVVHDAVQFAGPGAEIVAVLQAECFGDLTAPIERVAARFVPTPAAPTLEAQIYPSAARVVEAVARTLEKADAGG